MTRLYKSLFALTAVSLSACLLISSAKEEKAKSELTVLTDKQIAALKTEYTNEETKKTYKLASCSITPAGYKTAVERAKLKKSGKVPVRIVYSLYEISSVGGRQIRRRLNGTCNMYVKDADGKVVVKQTVALNKMCPS